MLDFLGSQPRSKNDMVVWINGWEQKLNSDPQI